MNAVVTITSAVQSVTGTFSNPGTLFATIGSVGNSEHESIVWGNAGRMLGTAYVGDKLAAEAYVTCMLVDRARSRLASSRNNSGNAP